MVSTVATEKLKEPILDSHFLVAQRAKDALLADETKEGEKKLDTKKDNKTPTSTSTSTPTFKMPPPPYTSNFSPDLLMIIRECKYLDRQGFPVPEAALNVTLQEDKYHHYVMDLDIMLKNYNNVVDSLSTVEKELLKKKLAEMQKGESKEHTSQISTFHYGNKTNIYNLFITLAVMKTGFTPLNWNSQRIPSFIEACNKEVEKFKSVLGEIQKNAVMIEEVVSAIDSTVLVEESDYTDKNGNRTNPLDISEFYDLMEAKRMARLEVLVQKYHSIKPLLIKVEMDIANSDKGMAPQLSSYYFFWEKRMYNAITRMIVQSMATFLGLIQSVEKSPLCQVKVTLNGKDVVVSPALGDIYKYLNKCVKNLPESSKMFYRWMRGTCLEAQPQIVNDDEEQYIFSFYQDISQNPYVVDVMVKLNQSIYGVFATMNKYLDGWMQYERDWKLWNPKRKSTMDKLAEKNPPCVFFDDKLSEYEELSKVSERAL